MPGWRERLAGRSSHPSARAYGRANLDSLAERVEIERKRAQDAWGLRYGQEVDGVRDASEEGYAAVGEILAEDHGWDFVPDLHMPHPGTAEFTRRYIPPGEPVIEQIETFGPEGFRIVRKVDGMTGELLEETSEVIGNLGPGEIVPGA